MSKLEVRPTATTPEIVFDDMTGLFLITGRSLPENSHEFFRPIHDWINQYVGVPLAITTLEFKLEYFNTSSTAHFLKLLKKLEDAVKHGSSVMVKWYYEPEDDDMREAGEDFQTLTSIPIEILAS